MCISKSVVVDNPLDHGLKTDVAVLSVLAQKALDLSNECASFFVIFYPTRPVLFASGYEHLLGIRGHRAIDALLALNVQACWGLSALTCRRWTSSDGGNWRWCEGNVDARGEAAAGEC